MSNQKETEKKIKKYVKAAKGAYNGKARSKKKLKKMIENDLITVIAKRATNHPEWYTRLGGELIGLNYGALDQLGDRIDLIRGVNNEPIAIPTTTDAIIILAMTATSDDTVRVAAQKLVNELRLVSGANTIYDVDDAVDYLLNIRSIWASLTQVRRAVRCLNVSDPHDIDAWRKYLAMALDDTDNGPTPTGFTGLFRQNAANIVNWLNTIVKSVRFMMPGNFTLFERTSWLFTNIFVDGTGAKFGTKMFVAPKVPYYTHTSGSTAHTATTKVIFGPDRTPTTMMEAIQEMVTDFTTRQANVAIAGDLMKAYGMASFYDPGQIGYTEKPPFVYDERALEQIANADVALDWRSTQVYQYDAVNAPLTLTYAGAAYPKDQFSAKTAVLETKFVNTEDNDVTPGETLSLTRLKCTVIPEYTSGNLSTAKIVDCGTEVVLDYIYVYGITTMSGHDVLMVNGWIASNRPTQASYKAWFSQWSIDDYSPMALLYDSSSGNQPGSGNQWKAYPVFDFSNWALMSRTEQRQFHKTAVLSLMTPIASVVQQAVAKL